VVLIAHQAGYVALMDQVSLISKGRIVRTGPPKDVLVKSAKKHKAIGGGAKA